MSRVTITGKGAIVYRTSNMPVNRAAAFARCLEANAARFCEVEIIPAKTKEESYFVTFRPVNPERQGDMYEAEWNVRRERAQEEGAGYVFCRDEDKAGVTWVYNPVSQETYEVGIFGCTCPDYEFRCANAAIHCKHMMALEIRAAAERVRAMQETPYFAVDGGSVVLQNLQTREVESREAFHARMKQNVAQDF